MHFLTVIEAGDQAGAVSRPGFFLVYRLYLSSCTFTLTFFCVSVAWFQTTGHTGLGLTLSSVPPLPSPFQKFPSQLLQVGTSGEASCLGVVTHVGNGMGSWDRKIGNSSSSSAKWKDYPRLSQCPFTHPEKTNSFDLHDPAHSRKIQECGSIPWPTWHEVTAYKVMPPLPNSSKCWLRAIPETALILPRTASSSTAFAGEGCGPLSRMLGDINNIDSHSESDLISLHFWGSPWTDSLGLSVMILTSVNSSLLSSRLFFVFFFFLNKQNFFFRLRSLSI